MKIVITVYICICFSETTSCFCSVLSKVCLFYRTNTEAGVLSKEPGLFSPTSSFLKKFSAQFYLKLSSVVLNKISSTNSGVTSKPLYSVLQELGGKTFDKVPSAMLEDDKLPYDELWKDIMQNINKGEGTLDYIHVTHSELDRLEQQLYEPEIVQGQKTAAVFFTCGHYYTKDSFVKETERLNKEQVVGGSKLPETMSVIKEYYSRKGCMNLACPRCVHSALMMVA